MAWRRCVALLSVFFLLPILHICMPAFMRVPTSINDLSYGVTSQKDTRGRLYYSKAEKR